MCRHFISTAIGTRLSHAVKRLAAFLLERIF
jgi:hypothetical protein